MEDAKQPDVEKEINQLISGQAISNESIALNLWMQQPIPFSNPTLFCNKDAEEHFYTLFCTRPVIKGKV